MKTKSIPYGKQWIGEEEIRAVTRVLHSDFLTQGPLVAKFEAMLAKKVGAKYAVAVANGTAALHLAAIALELKSGDEVITTPISFLATANAILYVGAKPVFADIDPDTQCIDPAAIEKAITPCTKAIFFTDFEGHPAELKKIHAIAKKYRLSAIEDAAHALGSTYYNSKIGSCRYSDMTIFSFHPVKHITTGEGGAITTNDVKLYKRLCALRTHGVTRDPEKLISKDMGPWYYEMQDLGFNYRLTDIQAALGIEQLKKLDRFIGRRRSIADRYCKGFSGLEGILTPVELPENRHVYHLFVIRLRGQLSKKRKKVFEELQQRGIGVQVHYIPIPAQPYYRKLGYRAEDCPRAQAYYSSAISLPMFPKMTDREVTFVIKTVKDVVCGFSQ
jgi:UDP-4-amino-4,6-dideoxy-N-acetyl-beta-L-altrosamine transaminase